MNIRENHIKGLYIIEPIVYSDERGYFYESFNEKEFNEKTGANFHPVQDNESKSTYGVLRGLHFQEEPHAQSKLVRVVKGLVMDVAVDLRKDSETCGEVDIVILSEVNKKQFFIPKGFAHGFVVLSDEAVFQYKVDDYYHPECENGISWDDKDLAIPWSSMIPEACIVLSEKDKNRQSYCEYISNWG